MIPFLRHPCGIPGGSQEKHGKPLVPNGSESARRTDGNLRSGRLYERKFFPRKKSVSTLQEREFLPEKMVLT
ncbi:MAG: hypothetical protein CW346_14580 [Bacillaceae bacterium]|nr:hypothetical protein [Bacillaceae bacterium]